MYNYTKLELEIPYSALINECQLKWKAHCSCKIWSVSVWIMQKQRRLQIFGPGWIVEQD